ncbi:MAG: pilus assembly protein N-terminal domain-containing protein [Planctomycetota bacterium]
MARRASIPLFAAVIAPLTFYVACEASARAGDSEVENTNWNRTPVFDSSPRVVRTRYLTDRPPAALSPVLPPRPTEVVVGRSRDVTRLAQRPDRATQAVPPPVDVFPPAGAAPARPPGLGVRLESLPDIPEGLRTPQPDAAVLAKYDRFVAAEIDADNTLDLLAGRPRILRFRTAPLRIYLPDEDVITFQTITEREIAVVGLEEGTATLTFWFADPDGGEPILLSYLVRVVPDPERRQRLEAIYQALETEINRNFPDSVVRLSLVGERLLLRGQAKDIEDATQILRIVGDNAPGGPEAIPLTPNGELAGDVALLAAVNPNAAAVTSSLLTPDSIDTARDAERTVINMLRVPGEQQVHLKVVVAEVNRSALRTIGANISIGSLDDPAQFFSVLPVGALGGNFIVDTGDFDLAINALRTLGLARSLAEPNLVTLNGRPASFNSGGSFPVPSVETAGNLILADTTDVGFEFIPFGVSLTFVPTITDKDRIRLQLFATVNDLDESIGFDTGDGGGTVSGLAGSTFTTTLELREGETMAVAGLIQNSLTADSIRVPFFGDLPYIGRLFKVDDTASDETELIVLVTPQLVRPASTHGCLPVPGSDIYEPDDKEFYLRGDIEGRRTEDFRSPVRTTIDRQKVFSTVLPRPTVPATTHGDGTLPLPPRPGAVMLDGPATPIFPRPDLPTLPAEANP